MNPELNLPWPLDTIGPVEHLWPYFLAAWAVGILAALLVAWKVRERFGTGGIAAVVLATLLSLIPSVRDWVLPASTIGLTALWLVLSWLAPAGTGRVNTWLAARWRDVIEVPNARFAPGAWLLCFGLYLLLGLLVLDWLPVISDSQAQLFHARVLLEGRTYAPAPPLGEFFMVENMVQRGGRWYSIYPLGHIVPLALGLLVRAPWAVNPFLGATAGWLVYRTTARLAGERSGRLAWLLFVASPFTMIMSACHMSHASAGVALMLQLFAVTGLVRGDGGGRPGRDLLWGALTGFGAGWLVATRPLTALVFVGVVSIVHVRSAPALGWRRLVLFAAAAVPAAMVWVVPQLLFNDATNGDPLRSGYEVLFPGFGWGFVETIFGTHTPFRAVEFALRMFNASNLYVLGLPVPGLLVVAVGVLVGRATLGGSPASPREGARWRWLAGLLYLAVVVAYAGYFYSDVTFGPRYTYEATLPLFALAALGLPQLVARVDAWLSGLRRRPVSSLPILILIYALSFTPHQMLFYHRAYSLDGGVVALAERTLSGPSLVFVEGPFRRAFFAVRPGLDQEILFARDLGERNRLFACLHRSRAAYVERDGVLVPFRPACDPGT